jgi:hypothetical protein
MCSPSSYNSEKTLASEGKSGSGVRWSARRRRGESDERRVRVGQDRSALRDANVGRRSVRFESPLQVMAKRIMRCSNRQGRALAVLEAKSNSVNRSPGKVSMSSMRSYQQPASHRTSSAGLNDGRAPIPDTRKGGVRVAPIAGLRRDEYITVICRKPTIRKLSFVRAVIAERWAWELTIGIRRGCFCRRRQSRRQTRRGRCPPRGQRPGIAPPLELSQEFDQGLLVFGAQLAEPQNDLT